MFIPRLINLVLRMTDLVEAEGRVFRASVTEFVIAALVFTLAGTLGVLACGAFAAALALALWDVMPPPAALMIVGMALALIGLLVGLAGRRLAMPDRRIPPNRP